MSHHPALGELGNRHRPEQYYLYSQDGKPLKVLPNAQVRRALNQGKAAVITVGRDGVLVKFRVPVPDSWVALPHPDKLRPALVDTLRLSANR